MDTIKNWCSNKENIKILIMIGMALILIFVLKNRFSETSTVKSDSSNVLNETGMESQTQVATRDYDKRIQAKTSARTNKVKFNGLKPPPFLKRDLFSSSNLGHNPKREAAAVEEIKLELTATIIDDQGALAIIGNEVLGMGEMVKGLRVTAIKKNEVILSKGKRQHVLRINEE